MKTKNTSEVFRGRVLVRRARRARVILGTVAFLVQAPCGLGDRLSNGMFRLWRVLKRRCGPTAGREHGGRGFRAPARSRVTCFWDVPVVHFSRIERRRISRCTSHREWISPDWILTSALEEANDGILTELDVLAMFSAQAEDPWLFGDAIDDLLEGVMVAASMYLHAAALAQLTSTKCRIFASSAEDPWTLQLRLNGPHLCESLL